MDHALSHLREGWAEINLSNTEIGDDEALLIAAELEDSNVTTLE